MVTVMAESPVFSDTTTLDWLVIMAPWSSDLVIQKGAPENTLPELGHSGISARENMPPKSEMDIERLNSPNQ